MREQRKTRARRERRRRPHPRAQRSFPFFGRGGGGAPSARRPAPTLPLPILSLRASAGRGPSLRTRRSQCAARPRPRPPLVPDRPFRPPYVICARFARFARFARGPTKALRCALSGREKKNLSAPFPPPPPPPQLERRFVPSPSMSTTLECLAPTFLELARNLLPSEGRPPLFFSSDAERARPLFFPLPPRLCVVPAVQEKEIHYTHTTLDQTKHTLAQNPRTVERCDLFFVALKFFLSSRLLVASPPPAPIFLAFFRPIRPPCRAPPLPSSPIARPPVGTSEDNTKKTISRQN